MRTHNISLHEIFNEIPQEMREETRLSFAISNRPDALMHEKGLNKKQFAEAICRMPSRFNIYDQKIDLSAIKKFCRENGRTAHYSKDDVFVQQGYVGKYLGVVESGYFKYTTLTSSGNEAVVGFAFEGEIVADYYNSFHGIPSEVTIKSGTDSRVSQIRTPEARNVFYASFDGNLSALNGALFSEIYSRHLELYRKTPTERYLDLITLYPQIIDIVSLRDIASYLLVTPVYLRDIQLKATDRHGIIG